MVEQLANDLDTRFDRARFETLQKQLAFERGELSQKTENVRTDAGRSFTFLDVPEEKKTAAVAQLGLFDAAPQIPGKAQAYLSDLDEAAVFASSARIISTIRTTERPEHDSVVLLTARNKTAGRYVYKLAANVAELKLPGKWLTGTALSGELKALSLKLKSFGYDYSYEGDRSLEPAFGLLPERPRGFTALRPHYVRDTLVVFGDKAGLIGTPGEQEAEFFPFEEQGDRSFYQSYVRVRDAYYTLFETESKILVEQPGLRNDLNEFYQGFVETYGELNKTFNRSRILNDPAFGLRCFPLWKNATMTALSAPISFTARSFRGRKPSERMTRPRL
jgi:hypothetical protein